jgi:outer membrane receptor protein involved in Fe transport
MGRSVPSCDGARLLLAGLGLAIPALALAAPAPAPPARPASTPAPAAAEKEVQSVVVTAQPADGVSSIDRRSYTLGRDLQSSTGSIADTLRSVPSVQVDVQGDLTLRGDGNVTIMVDGKPSAMFSGPNRGQVLQQIPATQFERIEVLTNPSAAFSPEGTAGVINLVTKQNRGIGFTGSVRANVGTGDRQNGGLNLANNTATTTVAGDIAWRHDPSTVSFETIRSRLEPATGLFADSRQSGRSAVDSHLVNGRLALNYDLDSENRINADLRYLAFNNDGSSNSRFDGLNGGGAALSRYGTVSSFDSHRRTLGGSTDWRRRFSGEAHELTLRLSLDRTTGDQISRTAFDFQFPAATAYVDQIGSQEVLVQSQLRTEYKRPLPNGDRLTAGYELNVSDNDYDNFGAKGPNDAALAPDTGRTNRFLFDQTVHAAFGTFQHRMGKLSLMPGLRLEQVEIGTNQVTSGLEDDYSYLRAYPTLHLQYQLGGGAQVNASYARRVQRPAAQDLNPFRIYQGIENFREGDSRLRPQVTDSFELGYQVRRGTTFYQANAYARFAKDGVTDLIQNLGGNVFLTKRANLAESRTAGLELVANGRLSSKLTYNLSANGFHSQVDATSSIFTGKRSGFVVTGYGALNLQVTPDDFLQVSGNVQGKQVQPQGYRLPTGMLNLGYRHKFSDRVSGVMTVQDALGTYRDARLIDTPALVERRNAGIHLRGVFIGLTYSFGGNGRGAPAAPAFDFGAGGGAAP